MKLKAIQNLIHCRIAIGAQWIHQKVTFSLNLIFSNQEQISNAVNFVNKGVLIFQNLIVFSETALEEASVPRNATIYKVYPERWWMVISVLILDIANNAHWVAFPAVSQR